MMRASVSTGRLAALVGRKDAALAGQPALKDLRAQRARIRPPRRGKTV